MQHFNKYNQNRAILPKQNKKTNKKMASFNPSVLKQYAQSVKERAKGGDTRVFKQKEIEAGKTLEIRLLKPQPNQGGEWKFFVETVTHWINKKPYLTNTFLDRPDVIQEELEEALSLGDRSLTALVESDNISRNIEYYFPMRIVEVEQDDASGDVVQVKFPYPTKDMFCCSVSVMDGINDLVCAATYQKGRNGNGIFDRVKGNSIILSKAVEKNSTKYKAIGGLQFELPEEAANPEKTPDIIKYLKKNRKSDEFLRGVIRNYLYGEPMPDEDIWKEDEEDAADNPPVTRTETKVAAKERTVEKPERSVREPAPKAAVTARPARNLADDLDRVAKEVEDLEDM